MLIAFNSTHCPFAKSGEGGTYILCQTFYLCQFKLDIAEITKPMANIVLIVCLVVLLVLVLVCTGLGVKIRNKANQAMESIREKY